MLSPEVDASLAALQAKGILGAAEARRASQDVRDAARVLCTVNPQRKSSELDAMLRAVHQPGLLRRGDAELLLAVHGADGRLLARRARQRYQGTLRGALVIDLLTDPAHGWLLAIAAALAVLSVAAIVCHVITQYAQLSNMFIVASAARPVVWVGVKAAVLAGFVSMLWSVRALARAALGLRKKAPARSERYVRPVAALALVFAGAWLGRGAPFLFVVGCAAAVYVLRSKRTAVSRSGT